MYEKPRVLGKGGFKGVVDGPGNYGVSLWRNGVINIDMRPQTYNDTFKILARDDLNIEFMFHATISIEPDTVKKVVQEYGGQQWYKRYVQRPFRTFVRQAVQKYESRDVKDKRANISDEVRTRLSEHLAGTPFKLVTLVVGNIDYPPVVAQAVEKKLAAQQLLQEKQVQKQIAQKDAEIRIEEAKGIAEAQKIINATLTPNYLQHEAIAAQKAMANSPNHTTVYVPSGSNGIPLVGVVKQ